MKTLQRIPSSPLWLWLIPVLLLSIAIAARMLNADLLFVDEWWSIYNSGGLPYGLLSPVEIWQRTVEVDPGGMGVGYHWLLSAWMSLVSSTPYSIRALSLLAGVVAVACAYRLGVRVAGRRVGLYAALALASSAFFIDYMHEGRAYTLFALLSCTTAYAYWGLHRQGWRWPDALLLLLSLTLAFYVHFVALALGAIFGVYHLLHFRRQRVWWGVLALFALSGLLYVPYIGVALDVIQRGTVDNLRHTFSMNGVEFIPEMLHAFSSANIAFLLFLMGMGLTLRLRARWLLLLWLGLGLLLVTLVNARIPFMVHVRYLIFLLPPLLLLVALGIERLRRYGVAAWAVLLAWGGLGYAQSLNPAFIGDLFGQVYRAPWAGLEQGLDVLEARSRPTDRVLFHISQLDFEPFNYFVLDWLMWDVAAAGKDQFEKMNNSFAGGDNDYLLDVEASLARAPFVWTLVIPDLPTTNKSNVTRYWLETQYAQCETPLARPDLLMQLHARRVSDDVPEATVFLDEGGQPLSLYHLRDEADPTQRRYILGWRADAVPLGTYSIGVHLVDAEGRLVGQNDAGLPDARPWACSSHALEVAGLPAGDYYAYALVYNWQTGKRLLQANGDDRWLMETFNVP